MTTKRFALETEISPLTHRLAGYGLFTFLVFFFAGPALESGSDLLVGGLLTSQAVAIFLASPLLRELLCDSPRLTVDDEGLGFRHFGDDWLRTVAWDRVERCEVLPGTLLLEYSETKDEEGGTEAIDLTYCDATEYEIRAALAAVQAVPENVVPLRRAA